MADLSSAKDSVQRLSPYGEESCLRERRGAIRRRNINVSAFGAIRLTHIAFAAALLAGAEAAHAACSPVGSDGSVNPGTASSPTSVTCSGTIATDTGQGFAHIPPVTNPLLPANNVNLTVLSGTQWQTNGVSAISLNDSANITVGSGMTPTTQTTLVQTTATGTTAPGSHFTNGASQGGYNTIEVNSGSMITIGADATVRASGNSGKNEAINVFGDGNHILNYGRIISDPGAGSAIFFQNWFADVAGHASNSVDNYGTIQAPEAIGSIGNIDVNFINRTGATVNGNLNFQGGDDTVTLESNSTITGNLNGGAGTNRLFLDAAASTQDTMSGLVQNFGLLEKTGPGTWTLTGTIGNNTASGSSPLEVDVFDGTLALEGDNTNFNGSVVVNPLFEGSTDPGPNPDATLSARAQSLPPLVIDHGRVVFNQIAAPGGGTLDGVYAGVIDGEGTITKGGPGTTVLTGNNTYTGTTTITNGTLQLGNGGASGAIGPGAVINNGTLAFDRSDARTFGNEISGTGSLAQRGAGTTVLTGDNTYSGGTSISAGSTLQAGDGGASGSIGSGDVADEGTLVFDRANTLSVGGTISGSGTVVQQGTGTTILTADNTWTGGTAIANGTLQLGNGGTTGSLVGDVANHGTLAFDRSDTYAFDGVVSGTGGLTQLGSGTTVLSADNTYTGVTAVSAGTLAIGDASSASARLSGGGEITVASGATLGGYGTVAGNVTNSGTIAVANALAAFRSEANGTFTLLGNLNNAGNLNLAGSTPGNVLLVEGNYTAGPDASLTLNTRLSPGGPLSEQTTDRLLIKGDPPGTTLVHVQPTADSPGGFTSVDFIQPSDGISIVQVAGASTTTAFELPGGYVINPNSPHEYRLYGYGPGSIHGTADPSQSLVGNAGGHWDYRLQSAYVTPEGPVDPDEPDGAVPGPEPGPGEEPIPGPNGEKAFPIPPDARPQIAPQVAAYLSAPAAYLYAGQLDLDMLHRRLGEIRDGQEQGGNGGSGEMFFRAYGGDFHYTTNHDFQHYGYDTTGSYAAIQFGANVFRFPSASGMWRFGLAGTVGWLNFEPEAIDGPSRSQSNIYRLSGYATYQSRQGWYVDNILSVGWFNGTIDTAARGQAMRLQGSDYAASVEAGYPFALPYHFNIEPQLQLIGQHIGFHNATDVDGLAVNIGSQNQLTGRIGARVTRPFDTSSGRITPYAGIDYLHAFVQGGNVQVSDVNFAAGKLGDALQYALGINGTVNPKLSLYGRVSYQQKIGNGGFSGWLINGGARYVF